MKVIKYLAVAAALPLLGACALGDFDFAKTEGMKAGTTFGEELKLGYMKLATMERDETDWVDAAFFHEKAKMALAGPVGPQELADRTLPAGPDKELEAARGQLMAVLDAGAGTSNPKMAALAQTSFDCWMQEQEENFQPEDIAACRKNFEMAMAALAGTLPGPYVVYFDFASAAITADAKTEIMKVAAVYKNGGVGSISLAGNTDTVGNAAANQALSEKRAAAVASALKGAGVPASAIKMSYAGETKLKINTEDNVQERLNRRVEIMLKP